MNFSAICIKIQKRWNFNRFRIKYKNFEKIEHVTKVPQSLEFQCVSALLLFATFFGTTAHSILSNLYENSETLEFQRLTNKVQKFPKIKCTARGATIVGISIGFE